MLQWLQLKMRSTRKSKDGKETTGNNNKFKDISASTTKLGASDEAAAKINAESVKALSEPEMAKRLSSQGAEPSPGTPEALGKFMRDEYDNWVKVIKTANIKLE
jgi:tripartite-type tricarboxylate transporter receptor subunit TctC